MKQFGILAFAIVCALICWSSFRSNPQEECLPANVYQTFIQEDLTQLEQAFAEFQNNTSLKNYLAFRAAFKQCEAYLAFVDPYAVQDYINGAPLPKVEKKVPGISVLQPKGLQVIDELMAENNTAELKKELSEFSKQFKEFLLFGRTQKLTEAQLLQAMRIEIIRVFTLGITGFDSPGTVNSITDAWNALRGIQRMLQSFECTSGSTQINSLYTTTNQLLSEALSYLKLNPNFNTFNRAEFYKNHLLLLDSSLLEFHKKLHLEFPHEVTTEILSTNYLSTSLFTENFFNKPYYLNGVEHSEAQIKLGRTLFFDPILSFNNQRSCASCHKPELGFADGLAKSVATDFKGTLNRNAPTVLNAVFTEKYFHDLRAEKLEKQFLHVISSDGEFRTSYDSILVKLNASNEYVNLFQQAFQTQTPITKNQFNAALIAYLGSLTSYNSPFDKYLRNETNTMSQLAVEGFNLFMGKAACGTCHFAPTFAGLVPPLYQESESEVLGTPSDSTNTQLDTDLGRFNSNRFTDQVEFYKFSFKTPTVRNSALTAPYMHNGSYSSLAQVVDFYNKGGGVGLGFDLPFQTLPFDSLSLTQQEQKALIAFMQNLTDTVGLAAKPQHLPKFTGEFSSFNNRTIGGDY